MDILDHRLAKLYQLFSDHIVYVNDLASYEKEKTSYDRQVPLEYPCRIRPGQPPIFVLPFTTHVCSTMNATSADFGRYISGEAKMFANVVEMIRKLLSLPADGQRAKGLAYGLQLQVESDIYAEMNRLKDDLHDEEWRVIYGWLDASSGHCFVSHMLRRYSGDRCRMAQTICQ